MTAPPLVIFAYKRPDLLARTLAAIRSPSIPVVYAFSDAPKSDADSDGVAAVRRLLAAIDWADVRVVERAVNLGVGRSILDGVTAVLREHDAVVILEDDIEVAPGAYEWMAAALAHYANEPRVMNISAWTHPRVTPPGLAGNPFFSGRPSCWGWATWARAWDGMLDHTALEFLATAERNGVPRGAYGVDIPALAAVEQELNIWAVRLVAHQMARRGLALHPAEPYARHVGWDPRATHATNPESWDSPLTARAVIPPRWPEPVEQRDISAMWRRAADEEIVAAEAPRRLSARVMRALRRLTGRILGS